MLPIQSETNLIDDNLTTAINAINGAAKNADMLLQRHWDWNAFYSQELWLAVDDVNA